MPPATDPIPVLILNAMKAALALPDGGANYYHAVTFAGVGRDVTEDALKGYPAVFMGEPSEIGQYTNVPEGQRAVMKRTWYWDIPVFGVINDVGMGEAAYTSLLKLGADIYRAVMSNYQLGGPAVADCQGWTILGPQTETQGRPWIALVFRVLFRTREDEWITNPA